MPARRNLPQEPKQSGTPASRPRGTEGVKIKNFIPNFKSSKDIVKELLLLAKANKNSTIRYNSTVDCVTLSTPDLDLLAVIQNKGKGVIYSSNHPKK